MGKVHVNHAIDTRTKLPLSCGPVNPFIQPLPRNSPSVNCTAAAAGRECAARTRQVKMSLTHQVCRNMPISELPPESTDPLPRHVTSAAAGEGNSRASAPSAERSAASDLDVSIVMPCLNEAEAVGECVRKALGWIERSGLTGEVVVVDNGSTDNSAAEAEAAGARVVRHAERGYGAALQRGFREARGRFLVMGDCDGTYEFGELDPLVRPLEDDYDLVMGNRLTKMLAPGAMPWAHRHIGTPLISLILRIFTGAKVTDSQCGIRGIRRDAVESLGLKSPGMEFASEMILKAKRAGLRISQVDVPYYIRTGESKLSTFRDGWRHLKFLLISSPSYVFVLPGLLFLMLGLVSLAVTVFTANGVTIGSVVWEPVYAAAILLAVGVNTMMLGLCSKLLGLREGAQEDGMVRFYRTHLGLGRILVGAGAMIAVGLGLQLFVLVEWLRDSPRVLLPWATVSATLIVIAANVIFAALAAAMIDPED